MLFFFSWDSGTLRLINLFWASPSLCSRLSATSRWKSHLGRKVRIKKKKKSIFPLATGGKKMSLWRCVYDWFGLHQKYLIRVVLACNFMMVRLTVLFAILISENKKSYDVTGAFLLLSLQLPPPGKNLAKVGFASFRHTRASLDVPTQNFPRT